MRITKAGLFVVVCVLLTSFPAAQDSFSRIKDGYEKGRVFKPAEEMLMVGRCAWTGEGPEIGVYLVFVNHQNSWYAVVTAHQLPDGSFSPPQEDLDKLPLPENREQLQETLRSIFDSSERRVHYRMEISPEESFTSDQRGVRYAYRSSDGRLVAERRQADGKVGYCEFGKRLL